MMAARIVQALAGGPLWPEDLYAKLWPGASPLHGEGSAKGGPSNRAVAVHFLMGRKPYREIAGRVMEHNGRYGRYKLKKVGGGG